MGGWRGVGSGGVLAGSVGGGGRGAAMRGLYAWPEFAPDFGILCVACNVLIFVAFLRILSSFLFLLRFFSLSSPSSSLFLALIMFAMITFNVVFINILTAIAVFVNFCVAVINITLPITVIIIPSYFSLPSLPLSYISIFLSPLFIFNLPFFKNI